MLVWRRDEKAVDSRQRSSRQRKGLSKGVLIHFQLPVRLFSTKNAVRAIKVSRWMVVTAQSWTDALARGVKISRA
jgi:hypothetical protein